MARERAVVQAFTGDGPILVAIHDVLADLHDLLDTRLPRQYQRGPVPAKEPAPDGPPRTAVPVSEPAPDDPPDVDEPDEEPAGEPAPEPPPLSGRGSSANAWADWARTAHVAVDDGASRDDIITACRSAGVIPEQ